MDEKSKPVFIGTPDIIGVWECICKNTGRMRGTNGYMSGIRERLPHEYPEHLRKQAEQTKCK